MTNEQAIKKIQAIIDCDLRELNTMPQHEALQNEVEALDMAIKALEQQPSDDCVDRNHVIATISHHHFDKDKDNFDLLIHNLCKEVKELPPVTPTHGTCKECKKCDFEQSDQTYFCKPYGNFVCSSHYCKDFEKRGNEND